PRNGVDQNSLQAKEHSRTQDSVGKPRTDEAALQSGFAAQVFKGRAFVRIGDAEMNDTRHPGGFAGVEQLQSVVHGNGVVEITVIEPDPVSIIKDGSASE